MVNNAGGSNFMVEFRDLRLSGWDKIMQLNLNSAVYVCHAFAGHLLDRGQGSVINVASVAGVVVGADDVPVRGGQGRADLAVQDAGRRVGRQRGPGQRAVPRLDGDRANRNLWEDPELGPAPVANVPMQRWGRAEEMAGPAVFLASDASSYMTGQVLVVDGGQTTGS